MKERADVWALISESSVAKEIYARIITQGQQGFDELVAHVMRRDFGNMDLYWLARLARIVALQPGDETRDVFARAALAHSVPRLPVTDTTLQLRKLLAEIFVSDGDLERAQYLVEPDSDLSEYYHGYLVADVHNPFIGGNTITFDSWLNLFNAPFEAHQMQPILVDQNTDNPFSSMTVQTSEHIDDGPLVSVILTTFNPDSEEILTSARSILRQTWRNLELLIVDDCSHESYTGLLAELRAEDPRIRLMRLPHNGGTYRARNLGLSEARGDYVTGQDTDDWSHPERIARQVRALEDQPNLTSVMVSANRMNDMLVRSFPGYNPHRRCEVSLMVRRETALELGGYLPVRKGADSEFRERIETSQGVPTHTLPDPLYIIRMSPGSLSRADFRAGWSHHARRNFWSAYKHWHHTAPKTDLMIDGVAGDDELPFYAPPRISGRQPVKLHAQLGFLCDWRADSFLQRAALDEVMTALEVGVSVALIHLESPHANPLSLRAPIPEVQQLINDGRVQRLATDEEAFIDLLIIRDPACIDYAKRQQSCLSVGKSILVADDSMVAEPAGLWNYSPHHAQQMTESVFNVTPEWATLDMRNSTEFSRTFNVPTIDQSYPLIIRHLDQRRRPFTSEGPVIGRAALNQEYDWPEADTLKDLYPIDGTADVRVLGDARGAVREIGERLVPSSWLSFRDGDITSQVFWRSVEFAVLFNRRGETRSHTREVLEAMAAECVVIIEPQAAKIYGDAVETATPEQVPARLAALRSDASRYRLRTQQARAFLRERCSPKEYLRFLSASGVEMRVGTYN